MVRLTDCVDMTGTLNNKTNKQVLGKSNTVWMDDLVVLHLFQHHICHIRMME